MIDFHWEIIKIWWRNQNLTIFGLIFAKWLIFLEAQAFIEKRSLCHHSISNDGLLFRSHHHLIKQSKSGCFFADFCKNGRFLSTFSSAQFVKGEACRKNIRMGLIHEVYWGNIRSQFCIYHVYLTATGVSLILYLPKQKAKKQLLHWRGNIKMTMNKE